MEPEYGISSTPVLVRSGNTATIYVVSATEPASMSFHTKLHALDLATGKDILTPHEIAPQANLKNGGVLHFDPQNQWNRASLTYQNGSVYVGVGSHCDNNAGSISGWLLRYSAATLKPSGSFATIKASAGYELASIWMSGYAPAIDDAGDVLAVTGQREFQHRDRQRGLGREHPPARRQSRHEGHIHAIRLAEPQQWRHGFRLRRRHGHPCRGGAEIAAAGHRHGQGRRRIPGQRLQAGWATPRMGSSRFRTVSIATCFCAPAYYTTAAGGVLFYQGSGDVIRSYSVGTGATPALTPLATGSDGAGFGGSFPIVSSNGVATGTGVVWALGTWLDHAAKGLRCGGTGIAVVHGQFRFLVERQPRLAHPAGSQRPGLCAGLQDGHGFWELTN